MGLVTIVTVLDDQLIKWAKNLVDVDFYDSRPAEKAVALKIMRTGKGNIWDSVTYAKTRDKFRTKILRAQQSVQNKYVKNARKNSLHSIVISGVPRKCGYFVVPSHTTFAKRKIRGKKFGDYITDKMANVGMCQLRAQDMYEYEFDVYCNPREKLSTCTKLAEKNKMKILNMKTAKKELTRNFPPQLK